MKISIRVMSFIAAAAATLAVATAAHAYKFHGSNYDQEQSYIDNTTDHCVRAYVKSKIIDVPPHSKSTYFFVDKGVNYFVSVFPGVSCGNKAVGNRSFSGSDLIWLI